uniref:HMG box domain-containing protein n=1 Tax=Loa loa TaxID=7209 RepID=A0A1I7W2I9_LOALO
MVTNASSAKIEKLVSVPALAFNKRDHFLAYTKKVEWANKLTESKGVSSSEIKDLAMKAYQPIPDNFAPKSNEPIVQQKPLLTTSKIHSNIPRQNDMPVPKENFNKSSHKNDENEYYVIQSVTARSSTQRRFVIFDSIS